MINLKFEEYKIKRELNRSGATYTFKRSERNEFKEQTGNEVIVGEFKALYHEQNGYIKITTGEAAKIRSKKTPMLLCLYKDVKVVDLRIDDIVKINSKTFKVTGITNIQEWNIIADISLEVIDDGVHD